MVTVPLAPWVTLVSVSASPSGSVSFASTPIVTGALRTVVAESSIAMGGLLGGDPGPTGATRQPEDSRTKASAAMMAEMAAPCRALIFPKPACRRGDERRCAPPQLTQDTIRPSVDDLLPTLGTPLVSQLSELEISKDPFIRLGRERLLGRDSSGGGIVDALSPTGK